jgi:hypothetical protein
VLARCGARAAFLLRYVGGRLDPQTVAVVESKWQHNKMQERSTSGPRRHRALERPMRAPARPRKSPDALAAG